MAGSGGRAPDPAPGSRLSDVWRCVTADGPGGGCACASPGGPAPAHACGSGAGPGPACRRSGRGRHRRPQPRGRRAAAPARAARGGGGARGWRGGGGGAWRGGPRGGGGGPRPGGGRRGRRCVAGHRDVRVDRVVFLVGFATGKGEYLRRDGDVRAHAGVHVHVDRERFRGLAREEEAVLAVAERVTASPPVPRYHRGRRESGRGKDLDGDGLPVLGRAVVRHGERVRPRAPGREGTGDGTREVEGGDVEVDDVAVVLLVEVVVGVDDCDGDGGGLGVARRGEEDSHRYRGENLVDGDGAVPAAGDERADVRILREAAFPAFALGVPVLLSDAGLDADDHEARLRCGAHVLRGHLVGEVLPAHGGGPQRDHGDRHVRRAALGSGRRGFDETETECGRYEAGEDAHARAWCSEGRVHEPPLSH